MIFLDINGRCGNQMFQYAFARKLMILNESESMRIDFFHVDRWRERLNGDTSFSDQLRFLNTIGYSPTIDSGNSVLKYGTKKQKHLFKRYELVRKISRKFKSFNLLKRYQRKLQRNGIFKEDECDIQPFKSKTTNVFVRGYFENPNYFDDIKDLLVSEFAPRFPKKESNLELYKIIEEQQSVCVSFRVWHDLTDEEIKKRDVCSLSYYQKAIEKMHSLIPNAHFIVFSNDIEWVKNNILFKYPVDFESGNDETWEKLRMMYSCKHFIMSTSTFCWWAQYLSRNKEKVVISPSKWYADGSGSKLIMDNWIKI